MKFAKITPSKQISEKDKLYQTIIKDHKHTQKESDSIPGKIMEEDLDETISNEVMALEEKGHNYEIGDTIETEEVAFVPMTKEIDDETAYNAFGTITSKSGNNYVIVVKSEKELTQDNLETVAEAVKEQVK